MRACSSHQIRKVKKDGVDVVIEVQENSPTVIQSVGFKGFPADAAERARKLAKSRDVSPGQVFDFPAFAALKERISDRMKEDGYAYGTVNGSVNVDRDKHVAIIEMEAQPGPQTRFGTTTVQGNGGIPAWKLLNRVTWKPGDAFNPHDLSTTQGRLYDLGVFSSVRLDLPEKPVEVADVKINVKPGKLYELRLGAGFGAELQREEVHGRFQLTLNNFLGGLRKLRIRINPAYVVIPSITDVQRSGPAAESDVQLTQPDVFGSNASIHALVGYDLGIAEGYQYVGPRAQVGIDRPFFRGHVLAGGFWNLQYLNFFNVDQDVFNGASDQFFGFRDPYRLAYLEEFMQIDLRNRPLDPSYGGFLLLHAEQSGAPIGSAFQYLKLVPDLRLYAPVGRRVVVAVRGLLGWLGTSSGQDSPITRRFALGGPSSHRGFGFGRLAPQVRDSQGRLIPVGGDGEVLGSAELRIDVHKIRRRVAGRRAVRRRRQRGAAVCRFVADDAQRGGRPVPRVHDSDRSGARRRRGSREPRRRGRSRSGAALRVPHHHRRSLLRRPSWPHLPTTIRSRSVSAHRPARRRDRILRVVGWVLFLAVGVAMLGLGAAILYARSGSGRERIRRLVVAQAQKSIPGLSIARIGGDYVHDLWLGGVEIRDDQGHVAVQLERVAARYRLWSLIRRTVFVDELDVDGVRVSAHPDPRGGLNLTRLVVPSPARPADKSTRPSVWKIRLERIRVAVAEAALESDDGEAATLHDAALDGSLALEGERVRAHVSSLSANAEWDDTAYALSLSDTSLDLDRRSVNAAVPALHLTGLLRDGAPLDLQASASGPLDRINLALTVASGSARIHSSGVAGIVVDSADRKMLGSYNLALDGREIDPALLASVSLAGQVGFDIHVEGQGVPLSPGSAARLDIQILPSTVAGVEIAAARIGAAARGDSWEVSPSVLDASGISVALQGRGSGHRLSGDVEVTADGQPVRAHHRGLDGRGRGKLAFHAEGEWPGRVAVQAHGGLRSLRVQSLRIDALKLDADVSAEQRAGEAEPAFDAQARIAVSGLAVADQHAASAEVVVAAQGAANHPSGKVSVRARHVQAGASAPPIDALTLTAAGDRGSLRVDAALSGPHVRGGLRAHGTLSARAADVSLDGLSADYTTRAYRQKLDLQRPAHITYRAGDEIAVQQLALKGAGARFTGEAVISGSYRLPPSRRDPLGRIDVQLAGASVGGLTPTDLRLNATLARRRAEVHLDAQMPNGGAQLHLDAGVPVIVSSRGTPRLAPRGDVTVHLKSNQVRLQSLPAVERVLARAGITGGTASVDSDRDRRHRSSRRQRRLRRSRRHVSQHRRARPRFDVEDGARARRLDQD